MIKLKNSPKKLLSVGFVGVRFNHDYTNPQVDSTKEPKDWLLSLLSKDDYYSEHAGTIFTRIDGLETMLLLRYPDRIEKIFKDPKEWT